MTFADRVQAAHVPVERIGADVLLSAGGDDRVWPSDRFAGEIAAVRALDGRATRVVVAASAGHRVRGRAGRSRREACPWPAAVRLRPTALSRRVWDELRDLLHLT